jgi:hypothetical protein
MVRGLLVFGNMNKPISIGLLALPFLLNFASFPASAEPISGASEVEIPVEELLAPTDGFDDNDNVQVVLHGVLPNACYTLGRAAVDRGADGHKIAVKQFALKRYTGICVDPDRLPDHMKLSVPFVNEVHVGQLDRGQYQFGFLEDAGASGSRPMNVGAATAPSIDSAPYALVTSVSIPDVVSAQDDVVVTLSGLLNSSCSQIDPNVKVLKQKDVFVLLPTLKIKSLVLCTQLRTPYQVQVNLGKAAAGQYLIHTRSMNGKAVNKVITVLNR